jgi:hypothetical protein
MEEYRVQGEAVDNCYSCTSRSDICNPWDRHLK